MCSGLLAASGSSGQEEGNTQGGAASPALCSNHSSLLLSPHTGQLWKQFYVDPFSLKWTLSIKKKKKDVWKPLHTSKTQYL